MDDDASADGRVVLPSGRIWWVPATLLVAWTAIAATPIPGWLGWTYAVGNLIGTGIALRLQVAHLEEWGDARPDRRPVLRLLCVAQLPVGWGTIVLLLLGLS